MLMMVCLLFGALLAQRCKVLALVPAIALVSLVTAIIGAKGEGTFWHILGLIAVDIAALQVGYLAGLGMHYLVNARQLTAIRFRSVDSSMSSRRTVN